MGSSNSANNKIKSNNLNWLPREIIYEILKRVPAESLVRFKVVCKLWKTIISDPKFIRSHLHIWESNPSVMFTAAGLLSDRLFLSDLHQQRDSKDFPIRVPKGYSNIVASTDGLLLLEALPCTLGEVTVNGEFKLKLCVHNPVTGIQKSLPPNPNLSLIVGHCFLIVHDASIQKYKVVVFINEAHQIPMEINIITVDNECSQWRKLISPSIFCWSTFYLHVFKPIAVNGILYWLAYNSMDMEIASNIESPQVAVVQSMDIPTEKFRPKISLPKRGSEHQLINCNLLEIEGSIYFSNPATDMELELWMLEEDLGNHIWVMKRKICLLSIVGKPNSLSSFLAGDSFHPIQMVGSHGLMIVRHDSVEGYMGYLDERSWYLYNLRSQELKSIVGRIPKVQRCYAYSDMGITHVKSLVGWN